MGLPPEEIAKQFRQAEIGRRQARNKIILNHAELTREELSTPEERVAHDAAVREIRAAVQRFTKEISPGYWTRLWRALLNK